MQLSKLQAGILAFLFERLPLSSDVDTLEFSLSGEFSGKFIVVYSKFEPGGIDACLVITLPTYSRGVFIGFARRNGKETARLLANLEDYERETGVKLGLGEAIRLPKIMADDLNFPHAAILLRTATSSDCAAVPDEYTIEGTPTKFFLAVPLTEEEWAVRQEEGQDALMNRFELTGKELYFEI